MNVLMLANAHSIGGGELSSAYLMGMLADAGHQVSLVPTDKVHPQYRLHPRVRVQPTLKVFKPTEKYDLFVLYANDFVYKLENYKDMVLRVLDASTRKVLVLNFSIGDARADWFLPRFDLVMFLNTTKQFDLLRSVAESPKTVVLPPPVDIEPFLAIQPDYNKVTFVRHGRYNSKYDEEDTLQLLEMMTTMFPDAHHWVMAAPTFLCRRYAKDNRFHLFPWNALPVPELLRHGNLFHHLLPEKLRDQGPRVIVEAMAAGIPVMADNRDGARDRVNEETGWLCNSLSDYRRSLISVLENPAQLKTKGAAAKARAAQHFRPERWVDVLIAG
jgi:glycosyltransferase involved in cell wall biosynthesis